MGVLKLTETAMDEHTFLTTGDVRRLFGVSDVTIVRWRKLGWLRGYLTSSGHLYRRSEVERFRVEREAKRAARSKAVHPPEAVPSLP